MQPEGIAVKAHDLPERRIEYLDMAVAGNLKRVASMVSMRYAAGNLLDTHEQHLLFSK